MREVYVNTPLTRQGGGVSGNSPSHFEIELAPVQRTLVMTIILVAGIK